MYDGTKQCPDWCRNQQKNDLIFVVLMRHDMLYFCDEFGCDASVMHEVRGAANRGEYYWSIIHFQNQMIKA